MAALHVGAHNVISYMTTGDSWIHRRCEAAHPAVAEDLLKRSPLHDHLLGVEPFSLTESKSSEEIEI